MPNISQITPPRVPLVDLKTGNITREWYRFIGQLFDAVGGSGENLSLEDLQVAPPATDYSNEIGALEGVQELPPAADYANEFSELDGLQKQPQQQLGTLAAVDEDNVRKIGFAVYPSPDPGGNSAAVGTAWWSPFDDTLMLQHNGGVRQQIGEETYMRVVNHTGTTIPNGTVVGFYGVNGDQLIEVVPFIADGTMPSLYLIGMTTEEIADAAVGRVTVWGRVRDLDTTAWTEGDVLYASPTVAGGLTATKPTAPNFSLPLAAVLVEDAVNGEVFIRPTIEQEKNYGMFSKTADATPAAINTAYAITLDTTNISNGVSIASSSRIVVANSGLYQLSAGYQLRSSSSSQKDVWLWIRKNGADVSQTGRIQTLALNGGYSDVRIAEFISLAANDYIELMWAASSTDVMLKYAAATAFAPSAPSVRVSLTQIQQ